MPHFIFVLGHSNDESGTLSATGTKRIEQAAALWLGHNNRSSLKIVLTGGFAERFNITEQPHWKHAKRALTSLGIPKTAIDNEGLESAHTVEDAALVIDYLRRKAKTVAKIITSDIHVTRSRLIFACLAPDFDLDFVGAESLEGAHAFEHEHEATSQLLAQGGVIWDGRLFPIPDGIQI